MTATTDQLLKHQRALLYVLLGLLLYVAWEVRSIRLAVQAELVMPSQSTNVPITINGVATSTKVTTTFREAPHGEETQAEWDERHIEECIRIRAAWEALNE